MENTRDVGRKPEGIVWNANNFAVKWKLAEIARKIDGKNWNGVNVNNYEMGN